MPTTLTEGDVGDRRAHVERERGGPLAGLGAQLVHRAVTGRVVDDLLDEGGALGGQGLVGGDDDDPEVGVVPRAAIRRRRR